MNGFRQASQGSRKERFKTLEADLKNSQMALRINQMMVQQLLQNHKSMAADLGKAFGLINELQYKLLALQSVASVDAEAVVAKANELRLKDFNEASDREDAEKGFTVGDVVKEDSVVILTSTTDEGTDKGIFRSRIPIGEAGPEVLKAFLGREVGAKAIVKLNDLDHTVELLGIRQPPATTAESAPTLELVQSDS